MRFLSGLFYIFILSASFSVEAQIRSADRSGFTWINTEQVEDVSFGAGYTLYSAVWPTYENYPGASGFQMGLAGCWLTTQRTGTEPDQFYTTIEGGLGWWGDTRFGKETPKFIMGGVSHDFFAWTNGPGAGRSDNLPNGQRDWSTPGGKYGVAQLSNNLLWAPDGLNMAQCLNGELLGYGYTPLPLTDTMAQTSGRDVTTGNQCWTLFLNTTNFKGPATFFLPTFWTEPVLEDPSLEGLFLDSRPSDPNIGYGVEHADSPALISTDHDDVAYAKAGRLQLPVSGENNAILMHGVSVYSQSALWNNMEAWFEGGSVVLPGLSLSRVNELSFVNNGGSLIGEISNAEQSDSTFEMDLSFMDNIQQNSNTMGYTFDLNTVKKNDENFFLPEYYRLELDDRWQAISVEDVPVSTGLLNAALPTNPRSEITYLTPLDPDCQWQDPEGPWNSPGPTAGPFFAELGDGSTVTYYWYRFIDQPAVIHANLPEDVRENLQSRVELIHTNWKHTDEYMAPPTVGNLATLDPEIIVQPPAGLEVGYVPIVTRQEKSKSKLRVFILAGQSNMEGYGTINDPENDPGSLHHVIANDTSGVWSKIGKRNNWTILDKTYIYSERLEDTLRTNVTVGHGAHDNFIGPELMFAHQLNDYYEDPILIIKTAWGGKSLAEDFRPPSAGGTTGAFYTTMIDKIKSVIENIESEFSGIKEDTFEISGFAWFQGWNDGASEEFLNEYESNLAHLVSAVRTDLGMPNLPFVIASSGHGGYLPTTDEWVRDMQEIVSVAQENVGCDDDTYGGRVGFVDTKLFYKELDESPLDAIHHFNNNALTFLNVGQSLGQEMISAINDKAYCYSDCGEELVSPELVSIGNRVWHDLNRNGINEADEQGIPGVSVVLWSDPDGDGVPDSQGFGGVQITDAEGYYNFSGLQPGNYVTFVWQVDNWGPGEPLENFVSSDVFEPDADNDIDFDNNGLGLAFSDIFSGIVTLTVDGEPLNDGDLVDCIFDYDSAGNNSVDFGFYNPNVVDYDGDGFTNLEDCNDDDSSVNPAELETPYNGIDDDCNPATLDDDLDQDGFALAIDCDDSNPNINPDAIEIPNNDIDEDCDGVDELSAVHELDGSVLDIFPNPVEDKLYIKTGLSGLNYEIYNVNGQRVLQGELGEGVLDLRGLVSGLYMLKLSQADQLPYVMERVVKK